jgi:hypothetical protein
LAQALRTPSTNNMWNWRSNGPAFLTFDALLHGNAAFAAALAVAPLPEQRMRLRKASMAVLFPTLWRWVIINATFCAIYI